MGTTFKKSALAIAVGLFATANTLTPAHSASLEEVTVVAEKRDESLQDLSQAVTALTSQSIEEKNITSFVDLSAVAPGVTVAKNEGYKTVISIRGVGNEANQNAIANPSVSYHMDGIYIASPFSLQADFIDVERIEALRGPQGTLFGQNSTGGAINVISKLPDFDGVSGKVDVTAGEYDLYKVRGSINVPVTDSLATRTSFAKEERDGFSENVLNGQDLDDTNNFTARTDWLWEVSDTTTLRFFGQYFDENSNGAAIKGLDDPTSDERKLAQDTYASYQLESQVFGLIAETDLGVATAKYLGSWQKDDISIVRDNDRHSIELNPEYTISAFDPETSTVETFTHEINLISNESLFGTIDWIVGAFYLDTEIENTIREELDQRDSTGAPTVRFDEDGNFLSVGDGVLDGIAAGDNGFISDANPVRTSTSIYGQATFHASDTFRIIAGLRYTEDEVESVVSNFFAEPGDPTYYELEQESDAVTGRLAFEVDLGDTTMAYASYTKGFKPGGTNLTFGLQPGDVNGAISDFNDADGDGAPDNLIFSTTNPLVFPSFEDETIHAYELGLKTDLIEGIVRANFALFYYDYENLQFQATDPDTFQGGVANIPESEIQGAELELTALLTDSLTFDIKLSAIDSEITSDYIALDNVRADGLGFFQGDDQLRLDLAENVKGNDLAKTPDLTADLSIKYEAEVNGGDYFTGILQYTYRGEFQQRIFGNSEVDNVDNYETVNVTLSYDIQGDTWGFDLIALNLFDEDGVNSQMSDVFGVNATGVELIPPRQVMGRVRYQF